MRQPDDDAPVVDWQSFLSGFTWNQGEHVTLVGPTGCGKTTLGLAILPRRAYTCALGTKPEDSTLTSMIRTGGYKRIKEWPPPPILPGQASSRIALWPEYDYDDERAQALALADGMRQMFKAGGWTIFADELFYLCQHLGLRRPLERWWTQGRSVGLTIVGATQRPAHVPLLAYDQATHLFFWRDNDETNLRRVGGLGGLNASTIRRIVSALPRHECLYVNTRDGAMLRTTAPRHR